MTIPCAIVLKNAGGAIGWRFATFQGSWTIHITFSAGETVLCKHDNGSIGWYAFVPTLGSGYHGLLKRTSDDYVAWDTTYNSAAWSID